ncbi:MAG: TolC family protein [Spirochaetes bacterium]|nr:TolC family protein [Spirochaetota bacterium]
MKILQQFIIAIAVWHMGFQHSIGESNIFKKLVAPNTAEYAIDLEQALSIAILNNFELRAIKAQKKINEWEVREAWRNFFPTLTLSYLHTDEIRERATDSRQHKLGFDSTITIYDGGHRSSMLVSAKLKSILAANEYRVALNNLIATVTKSYLELLQSRDAISIHTLTLNQGIMQLSFIQKELSLGDATKLDALAIEAKVKEMELNLEKSKDEYQRRLYQFKQILKLDFSVPITIIGNIEKDFVFNKPDERINEQSLIPLALKNRKEIENADAEYKIAMANYKINKNYYFPKLSVGFNYHLSDDAFFPHEKGWGINLKISSLLWGNSFSHDSGFSEGNNSNSKAISNSSSVQFFDSLQYKRAMLESTVQYKSAAEKKKHIRREIALEVSSLISSLYNSWKMIEISRRQLELYDSFLLIERLKAQMGESRRYDLVKKEIERGEAAIAYLSSMANYLIASFSLELATGVDIGFFKLYARKQISEYPHE